MHAGSLLRLGTFAKQTLSAGGIELFGGLCRRHGLVLPTSWHARCRTSPDPLPHRLFRGDFTHLQPLLSLCTRSRHAKTLRSSALNLTRWRRGRTNGALLSALGRWPLCHFPLFGLLVALFGEKHRHHAAFSPVDYPKIALRRRHSPN